VARINNISKLLVYGFVPFSGNPNLFVIPYDILVQVVSWLVHLSSLYPKKSPASGHISV